LLDSDAVRRTSADVRARCVRRPWAGKSRGYARHQIGTWVAQRVAAMTTAETAAIGSACVLHDTVLSHAFGARHLARLEKLGEEVVLPAGTAIFQTGEPSHFLYVVLDGVLVP